MALAQNEMMDLGPINDYLADKTPEQIIGWASEEFDHDKIFSLTSAGLTAPLILDLLDRTANDGISPKIPIIHNDTGFLPDQVYEYRDTVLEPAYDFKSIITGPTEETVQQIIDEELWRHDKDLYRQLTKLEPLGKKIGELGVQVLVTGVRQNQTDNRQDLDVITYGADGEFRLNPNFYLTDEDVEKKLSDIIKSERVASHPLYLVVEYVDDWQFLGEPKTECGINSADRLVRAPSFVTVQ